MSHLPLHVLPFILTLAAPLLGQARDSAMGCTPDWIPTFGGQSGVSNAIHALTVFDDGSGPALYVGGTFTSAGGQIVNRIAKWDGSVWSPLGGGVSAQVRALTVHDDGTGSGPALYVGGDFALADGLTVNRVARWDGTSWSALGNGSPGSVHSLVSFDDGGGPALYAAVSNTCLAKWDGASWSQVGGVGGTCVSAAVFDGGSGPALYLAGDSLFLQGGSNPEGLSLIRWDGSALSEAGLVSAYPSPGVLSLAVFDDGSGPALYAGGNFFILPQFVNTTIAKWDGTSWSTLASIPVPGYVLSLTGFDDGTGPALYAGGTFTTAGGSSASKIARWDGSSWSPLGAGVNEIVRALAVYDDGSGASPSLFVGGEFTSSPGGDSYLARFGGCGASDPGVAYCFGDGSGSACPCGNAGAPGAGCANSAGAGSVLAANGTASVTANDLALTGQGLPGNKPGVLFAGMLASNGGAGTPFGDGLHCAGGMVLRLGVSFSSASGTASWAPDLAGTGWTASATRYFQVWYRDQAGPCGSGFNLTNGYEVLLQP